MLLAKEGDILDNLKDLKGGVKISLKVSEDFIEVIVQRERSESVLAIVVVNVGTLLVNEDNELADFNLLKDGVKHND